MMTVRLKVNGLAHGGRCEPRKLLVDFIREDLGLTGTHVGCEHGICGACTIIVNGESARSCIMLAVQADGAELMTVEGLMQDGKLHPLQEAFRGLHGLQCGVCTPGMLMTALDCLRTIPSPSAREIREGISAVLCRCTGYQGIVNAVRAAAATLRGGREGAVTDPRSGGPAALPRLVGARVARREDPRFLTGQGSYVDDHRPARLLYAAFLRSPQAHARIVAIDASAALALPGVTAVLTGEEIARASKPVRAASKTPAVKVTSFPPLALGKVRHVGEAVAMIAAENRYVAEDAVERIVVEYEPLPLITDLERALEAASPLVHEEAGTNLLVAREFARGDVDAALASAAVVVRERFRFHRHTAICMENRGCLAEYATGSGTLTLRSSAQCPGIVRDVLTDLLDMPEHQIRVIAEDVGGGFGARASLYPEEIATCVMARRLGRPVKWIGYRREDLLATTHAWDEIIDAELGLDRDGAIVGLRAQVTADIGAYSIYPWTAAIEPVQTISFLPGPYRVPTYRGRTRGVATCKTPLGPYRGVGRPPAVFVIEGLMDRAARRLGLDPTEIRLRNFIRDEDFPYKSPSGIVWDRSSFTGSLLKAREALDYKAARDEQRRARTAGRWLGIGVASYVELTGIGSAIPVSPGMPVSTGTEAATIRFDPAGKVTAVFGVASHGQGLETTLAQIVADEVGVPIEDIRVVHGDTALSPYGTGTYASRSLVLAGGAAIMAGGAVREKMLLIAGHLLEAAPADVVLTG